MPTDLFKTLDTISAFHHYNSWIFHNIQPFLSGRVVDVGSGIGVIANYYKRHENVSHVVLTDGFEEMLAILRQKFAGDHFYSVMPMDISDTRDMPASLRHSADCLTCINVLEHIQDDARALYNMKEILKSEGRLVLMVPALPAIYGSLDTLVGHYRRYTKKSLAAVLQQSGFSIERQFYMNFLGVLSWFMAGRVLKYKSFDPVSGMRLDRFVPLFEKLESWIEPAIGQSLIAVCRKRTGDNEGQ